MASASLFDPAPAAPGRPPRPPSLAARLRCETRPHHDAIEQSPRLRRLMADDLTEREYVGALVGLLGFYEPVERGLRAWGGALPAKLQLEQRLGKSELLRRDVEALAPGLLERADIGRSAFGAFALAEQAWGCLYVLEGSTLGGQAIARRLASTLGVGPGRGASFHEPYGAETGARWQAFKAELDAQAAHGALDPDAVVAGAADAFVAMNAWMAAGR